MKIKDQEIEFGPLAWGAYVKLKSLMQKTLSGKLVRLVLDFLSSDAGRAMVTAISAGNARALPEDLKQHIPEIRQFIEQHLQGVIDELMATSDEFAEAVLEGCVSTHVSRTDLYVGWSAAEVLALRSEAIKHADFAALVALEKNWWIGLANEAGRIFGTSPSSSPDPT